MAATLCSRMVAALTITVVTAAVPPLAPTANANGTLGYNQRGINTNMLSIQSETAYDWPDEAVAKFGEPQSTYNYIASRGHGFVRIGFNWDVAQRGLTPASTSAPLDAKYMAKVTNEISKAKNAGLKVVLVLSNGCQWTDRGAKWQEPGLKRLICGAGLTDSHVANLWRQVSSLYRSEPAVAVYDLFNEPTAFQHPSRADMKDPGDFPAPYTAYKSAVNASIKAIRDNGDGKFIWVESLCCTMFHDFASTDPAGPWVVDPLNRIQFSQHMYPEQNPDATKPYDEAKENPAFDSDPGKYWSDRGYAAGFLSRLDAFGAWCAQHNAKCSIGEVGWPNHLAQSDTASKWNDLGDAFYNKANYYGFDVLYFGVQTGLNNGLSAYGYNTETGWIFPAPGTNRGYSPATVIEKPIHLSQ